MADAIVKGNHVYAFDVYVQESCILKAARAFLVFKAIEEIGEIIVSNPNSQDIEDEKFDFEFSLVVITKEEVDKVIAAAVNVSEIERVVGGVVDVNAAPAPAESATEEKAEEVTTAPAVVAEKESVSTESTSSKETAPAKATDKKKPVVNRTVRVDIEKLDDLMNLVSELIIAKNSLVSAATTKGASTNNVNEQIEYLESVTTNLHESVMKVRMVPIESVVNKFPRMIRDLQKKLNKKMELYMSGEETELDRTVVDEIGDPLMHLLRNSADHGIESDVKLRKERGKPGRWSYRWYSRS